MPELGGLAISAIAKAVVPASTNGTCSAPKLVLSP